jgi:hypothetical protein
MLNTDANITMLGTAMPAPADVGLYPNKYWLKEFNIKSTTDTLLSS